MFCLCFEVFYHFLHLFLGPLLSIFIFLKWFYHSFLCLFVGRPASCWPPSAAAPAAAQLQVPRPVILEKTIEVPKVQTLGVAS